MIHFSQVTGFGPWHDHNRLKWPSGLIFCPMVGVIICSSMFFRGLYCHHLYHLFVSMFNHGALSYFLLPVDAFTLVPNSAAPHYSHSCCAFRFLPLVHYFLVAFLFNKPFPTSCSFNGWTVGQDEECLLICPHFNIMYALILNFTTIIIVIIITMATVMYNEDSNKIIW